jgi:hypothetical protein
LKLGFENKKLLNKSAEEINAVFKEFILDPARQCSEREDS